MSPQTTPAPPLVSPATLAMGSAQQADVLVKKMMLSPPSALPSALLDVDHIVRGEQPLLNISQLKPVPFVTPMDLRQASHSRADARLQ